MIVKRYLISILLGASSLTAVSCSTQPSISRQVPNVPTTNRKDIIVELNNYRSSLTLPLVTANQSLEGLSNHRVRGAWPYRYKNLANGHQYFTEDVKEYAYPALWFGENLLSDSSPTSAAQAIVDWHNSDSHRALMRRKTPMECFASQAYDGHRAVIALICADRNSKELLVW
jgi:uncharacterized protein YkwD